MSCSTAAQRSMPAAWAVWYVGRGRSWAAAEGLALYPAQEEALIEILSGSNVIVSTPTGSGKSLIAPHSMQG